MTVNGISDEDVPAVKCAERSRSLLRRLADENGWEVVKDVSYEGRHRKHSRDPGTVVVGAKFLAEKDVEAGRASLGVSWWRGRLEYVTLNLVGSAVVGFDERFSTAKAVLTDPDAGYRVDLSGGSGASS